MSEQAKQTPLVDLLRQVPADFRCEWESDWAEDGRCTGHSRGPVGRNCRDAAAEIERLNSQLDEFIHKTTAQHLEIERLNASSPVSVDDRMPEFGDPVLIYSIDDGWCRGIRDEYWEGQKRAGESSTSFKEEYGGPITRATHWQPLPEPPKEVTSDSII